MDKWEMVRLGDVVEESITGEWGAECIDSEVGTKILRTTNFTNVGKINYNNVIVRKIPFSKVENKKLIKGDIILEKSGGSDTQPVGRVVFFENESGEIFLCNNFTQILRLKQNIAFPKYVFLYLFYLHQNGTTELLQNKTTGIRNLQIKKYMSIEIPLPSLSVQQQIADVLDHANSLIEKRKTQIKKLDLLIKSQFIEMFGDPVTNPIGWEVVPVIQLCDCMVPGRDKPKSFTGNIPWITIDDLCILSCTSESKKKLGLTQKEINEVNRKTIPFNSVIMSCVGNLGVTSIAGVEMIINQQLHSFQCGPQINPIYLMYELSNKKDYMSKMATSTTVAYMNKTVCNSIPIRHIPLSLQNQFADFVQTVESQKKLLQQSLTKLERNYKSLMQKCFRGEIF